MRIVVDTNVLVSRFLSPTGPPAQILDRWERQAFELVVSEPILTEYRRALLYQRVAHRHGMSVREVDQVIQEIRDQAILVSAVELPERVVQDPEDDKFLACAVADGADYVVSGDHLLLEVDEYRGIPVVFPRAFLSLLG